MENCNICGLNRLKTILSVDQFPYFTVPVSRKTSEDILNKYNQTQLETSLRVKVCLDCGHCHQSNLPDFDVLNDLYANYYHYPSPLEANFKPERDDAFIKIFNNFFEEHPPLKDRRKVLEVGCFDGYILHHLQKNGFHVTGCDPSEGALIGQKHGIHIYKAFFNSQEFQLRNEHFDIVISRHFIEHVITPLNYINDFKKVLNSEGLLVIEVPHATYYLSNGLMEVFSPQHIQGFSVHSLLHLLNHAGFSRVSIIESENNLIAFAQNHISESPKKKSLHYNGVARHFSNAINDNRNEIRRIILAYTKNNKKIAMWGAGGFAIAAFKLYGISSDQICFIIDSDPKKSGLKFLGIDLKIELPTEDNINELDLIVIASMYTKSIIETIRKINPQVPILSIYPNVQLHGAT